jgi:recombinational DNA repair protein (RecF pathway)
MARLTLTTNAFVLLRRPSTSDAFQAISVFSESQGGLLILQRVSKSKRPAAVNSVMLDLFSEAELVLESSNQGHTWFVRDARVLRSAEGIGRDYEALRCASAFAALVAQNAVSEESRAKVYALLRRAFAAFATAPRPDAAYVKCVYCLARDEGYPVKQQWFRSLAAPDREAVADLLNKPLAEQSLSLEEVARLRARLESWLWAETEILPG